ncbi:hypothetical protein FHX82_002246 [Amycolatopsis bartoniae]|uniref:Uncharacterized protein n=1 Tax=Amycolatopsis bartoniae TaxID=941986 RepID=A0A8H9M7L0_9PSEU|nr:hypothetical protein [Amycolatopsis bartoniae]MBB2935226.1 hypothetical protein [Amycolatopsis bartoniae]TVT04066.1 hypothetical protein FNH07_24585 [Amycolatopsis bartoniae]GHF75230.1 hypothetical protein GCM10017566_56450 [Amycolatopsis bartoniae]
MDVATRRVFRRVVCPRCGRRRTEMRVFGTDRCDERGLPKPRRQVREELRRQARAWHPDGECDRCARR